MWPWLWFYRCLEIMKGLIFMVHLWSLRLSVTSDLDGICNICAVLCSENACTTSSLFFVLKKSVARKFQPFLHIPMFLWTRWSSISKSNRRCANEINVKFVVLKQKCLFLPVNGIDKWQPLFFGGYGIVLRSFKKF